MRGYLIPGIVVVLCVFGVSMLSKPASETLLLWSIYGKEKVQSDMLTIVRQQRHSMTVSNGDSIPRETVDRFNGWKGVIVFLVMILCVSMSMAALKWIGVVKVRDGRAPLSAVEAK